MQDHLDLQGAYGATDRLRLIAGRDPLPATFGDFVYVRRLGATPQVRRCGAIDGLSNAFGSRTEAIRTLGASGVYVRLNGRRAASCGPLISEPSSKPNLI